MEIRKLVSIVLILAMLFSVISPSMFSFADGSIELPLEDGVMDIPTGEEEPQEELGELEEEESEEEILQEKEPVEEVEETDEEKKEDEDIEQLENPINPLMVTQSSGDPIERFLSGEDVVIEELFESSYLANRLVTQWLVPSGVWAGSINDTLNRDQLLGINNINVSMYNRKTFNAQGTSLNSLKGMEIFNDYTIEPGVGLYINFNFSSSSITNLEGLNNLTRIGGLNLSNCTQLEDISALTNLVYMNGALTITNSKLTDLHGLENLHPSYSNEFNADEFSGNIFYRHLNFNNNRLTDISALSHLTKVEYLTLRNNNLRSLSALSNLEEVVRHFEVQFNNLTDLDGLSGLKVGGDLTAHHNYIHDIESKIDFTIEGNKYLTPQKTLQVFIDGELVNFPDVQPFLNDRGRAMIPIRFVNENLGATVWWHQDSQTATIDRVVYPGKAEEHKVRLQMTVGENQFIVNNVSYPMDATIELFGDERILVPGAYIAQPYADVYYELRSLGSHMEAHYFFKTVPSNPDDNFETPLEPIIPDRIDNFPEPEGEVIGGIRHTLVINKDGEGLVSPAVGIHEYNDGETVNLIASPIDGYKFVNWIIDGVDVFDASTSVTINGNITATAYFEEVVKFSVYADKMGGGNINITSGNYEAGTILPLLATPNVGFRFAMWIVDGNIYHTPNPIITVNRDMAAIAYFEELPKHKLSVGVTGEGSVSIRNLTKGILHPNIVGDLLFTKDTALEISYVELQGYEFVNWLVNGKVVGGSLLNLIMDKDTNVRAVFNYKEEENPVDPVNPVNPVDAVVTVRYLDELGNELMASDNIKYPVGIYTIHSKSIPGHEVVEPKDIQVAIVEGVNQTVTFTYKKVLGELTVEFLDIDTSEKIRPNQKILDIPIGIYTYIAEKTVNTYTLVGEAVKEVIFTVADSVKTIQLFYKQETILEPDDENDDDSGENDGGNDDGSGVGNEGSEGNTGNDGNEGNVGNEGSNNGGNQDDGNDNGNVGEGNNAGGDNDSSDSSDSRGNQGDGSNEGSNNNNDNQDNKNEGNNGSNQDDGSVDNGDNRGNDGEEISDNEDPIITDNELEPKDDELDEPVEEVKEAEQSNSDNTGKNTETYKPVKVNTTNNPINPNKPVKPATVTVQNIKEKEQTKGVVFGKVTDSKGNPLAGIRVELYSKLKVTYTDVNGEYHFNDVELGKHTLVFKNPFTLSEIGRIQMVVYKDGNNQVKEVQDFEDEFTQEIVLTDLSNIVRLDVEIETVENIEGEGEINIDEVTPIEETPVDTDKPKVPSIEDIIKPVVTVVGGSSFIFFIIIVGTRRKKKKQDDEEE